MLLRDGRNQPVIIEAELLKHRLPQDLKVFCFFSSENKILLLD
jgi:hypothetical protein